MVQALCENERPERFERIVQSWDTANKATELSDFSVCTTWGVKGKNVYLLGLLRHDLIRTTERLLAALKGKRGINRCAAAARRSACR